MGIELRRVAAGAATVALALTVCVSGGAQAENPATGTVPGTGQELHISIASPVDGTTHEIHDDLQVIGSTGLGSSSDTALAIYMVDVSGSTRQAAGDCNGDGVIDAGDDLNGDNSVGTVLDCEIAGVLALNSGLPQLRPVEVAVIPWAATGVVADVDPTQGTQRTTTPTADNDGGGTSDLAEVARSIRVGRVGQFTPMSMDSGGTNFDRALGLADMSFRGHSADAKTIFFLTDGVGTAVSAPVRDALIQHGFQVQAFAVGQSTCHSSLLTWISAVHGTCTPVQDPTSLSAVLAGLNPVGIDRVEVRANGGPVHVASLDALGGFEGTIPAADLVEGSNVIEATVVAADGEATTVTADVTVNVPCDEAGLGDIAGLDVPVVSGTVHDTVEPLLEGTGLEDTVHDLNCDVIDEVEGQLIEVLAPLFGLLRSA